MWCLAAGIAGIAATTGVICGYETAVVATVTATEEQQQDDPDAVIVAATAAVIR